MVSRHSSTYTLTASHCISLTSASRLYEIPFQQLQNISLAAFTGWSHSGHCKIHFSGSLYRMITLRPLQNSLTIYDTPT